MKKIGFFGGTFDPIHMGHLNLAIEIFERHSLDAIFFCPARLCPEKQNKPPAAPAADRYAMTELAIEPLPEFQVLDEELKRKGPSYTIDTIHVLIEQYPKAQFYLILGEDVLEGIEKWKSVEELFKLAPPLMGTRPGGIRKPLPSHLEKILKEGATPIPNMEISSTALRERLAQGRFCGHLIPKGALDYIEKNDLYSENASRAQRNT